jgi:hypothetical protein
VILFSYPGRSKQTTATAPTMSDAAAFFATKKNKKKKAFKFNANLVDASTITHTTHV